VAIPRSYVGVVLIAVVFSTVLTLFMILERAAGPVVLIRNDAPRLDLSSEEKYAFSFSILFRRSFDEVAVRFSWFRSMGIPEEANVEAESIESLTGLFDKIRYLQDYCQAFGWEPEKIEGGLLAEQYPNSDWVLLLDFCQALRAGMTSQSHLVHSAYLFTMKDRKIEAYYEGIDDFFPEREWRELRGAEGEKPIRDPRSSGSVEVTLDGNSTRYVSPGERKLYPELPGLDELPPYGEFVFRNVKKDQRLTIMTFVQGRAVGFPHQVEMVRVYLDGDLGMVLVNPT